MDFDFRFSQFEILTGAGTLILCLFFISIFTEASAIENDLATEVTNAVASDELYWSGVEVSGQAVTLTGTAPDVPASKAAELRALTIEGVTSIENQIQIIGQIGTCQAQLDEYLSRESIRFKSGKADIVDESYNTIAMLAMIVRNCANNVEIAGHTDSKGDAEVNLKLSQRRAVKVAKHLVNHGVLGDKIVARGYGEQQPVADNKSAEGRKINRRIEFRVLGEAA
jgi:OOP family OmpA-OmpF porin